MSSDLSGGFREHTTDSGGYVRALSIVVSDSPSDSAIRYPREQMCSGVSFKPADPNSPGDPIRGGTAESAWNGRCPRAKEVEDEEH